MFFVDLSGEKDTVKILADLQGAYADNADLRDALGADNETFVRRGCGALVRGDAAQLGEIMTAAQKNFDAKVAPTCPDQLAGPLLHKILTLESIAEHIYGGKGVGSQGDGTAQLVARSPQDRNEAMKKITAEFPDMRCFGLTITPIRPARTGG
jgi:galactokinase